MCVILFYQKDMLIPLLSLTKKYDIRDFPWTSDFKMKLKSTGFDLGDLGIPWIMVCPCFITSYFLFNPQQRTPF